MELPWRVKLRQAEVHLGRFEEECGRFLSTSHVGFKYDVDPDEGSISVILIADSEPPMVVGAIVGDVLHNLRSALDSIAWETCQRAGVTADGERDIYFPVGTVPARWESLAAKKLPNVSEDHLQVFKELQPWYHDEEARSMGVEVDASAALRHPLYALHEMASRDRHRVPHPILARAGNTWLGSPDGVTVAAERADPPPWLPGSVILKWKVDPPSRVSDVHPDGEPILVFTEDDAQYGQSAGAELKAMVEAVSLALRRVEIEVLEVVTKAQLAELDELRRDFHDAQDAMESLRRESPVLDREYVDRHSALSGDLERARSRYTDRWRELFA